MRLPSETVQPLRLIVVPHSGADRHCLLIQHLHDILNSNKGRHLDGLTFRYKTEYVMKAVAYVLAAILGLYGLGFLMSVVRGISLPRLFVGIAALSGSYFLVRLANRPVPPTHAHRIDGDVAGDASNLEQIRCRQCGAELSPDAVRSTAGTAYVKCEYCGAQYQI